MLCCAPDPGYHGPKKKLRETLGKTDEYEADADGSVADAENQVSGKDSCQGAREELQPAANGGGNAEHYPQLAVSEIKIAQDHWKDQRFERRLGMVNAMRQADESERRP